MTLFKGITHFDFSLCVELQFLTSSIIVIFRDHATKLITYQNMRGGRVVFADVAKPNKTEWSSPLEAVEEALDLEKKVNEHLLEMHKTADSTNDPQLTDFIEGEFLEEQVEAIKEFGDLLTRLKRAGTGLGEHMIDKELQEDSS